MLGVLGVMAQENVEYRPTRATPWATYATGTWWELTHGEDFHQDPTRAVATFRMWARRHGYQCSAVVDGHCIYVKAWRD